MLYFKTSSVGWYHKHYLTFSHDVHELHSISANEYEYWLHVEHF